MQKLLMDQLYPLMVQLVERVRMLHSLGFTHRNLSTENIMLTIDKNNLLSLFLTDFSCAHSYKMPVNGQHIAKEYQKQF